MIDVRHIAAGVFAAAVVVASHAAVAQQQTAPDDTYTPEVGQQGKDVVWVPTSPELVEVMVDLAKVTPQDFVMDLGSGDGRNIIAAARRGAQGLGIEYNPDMVTLSERRAREAGVGDRAKFQQGDMYAADISKATVLALFLLPENLQKLQEKFLALPPGTRIVVNTFTLEGWEPAARAQLTEGCSSWCTALLLIVPARVSGTWQFGETRLSLQQEYEAISGTAATKDLATETVSGSVRAADVSLTIGGRTYEGRVEGDRMVGTVASGPMGTKQPWTAERIGAAGRSFTPAE